jgi:hypothetical protein
VPRHAGQGVRRVPLRRNIIDAETAQLAAGPQPGLLAGVVSGGGQPAAQCRIADAAGELPVPPEARIGAGSVPVAARVAGLAGLACSQSRSARRRRASYGS